MECLTLDPTVLIEGSEPTTCVRCGAIAEGKSGLELHHLGGRPSPLRIEVDTNTHRRLTLIQDLTWRTFATPGSPQAVLIDLLALLALDGGDA